MSFHEMKNKKGSSHSFPATYAGAAQTIPIFLKQI